MSTSDAVEFIKRVDSDQSIQARVKALSPTNPVGLIILGQALGYRFGLAEFQLAAQSLGRYVGDLSDDELDNVTGGAVFPSSPQKPSGQASLNFTNAFNFVSPK